MACKNEADIMIAGVRRDAELSCPPVQYITNRNESMNRIAQEYANYSHSI